MRDFPERTAPRRVPLGRTVAIGAALALTAGAVSSPSHAEDLRNKQRSIQSHEQKVQQDLDGSSASYRHAQARLKQVQQQLHAAKARVTKIQHALHAAEVNEKAWKQKLAHAQAGLSKAQAALSESQATLATQRLAAQQNSFAIMTQPDARAAQMSALLGADSLSDVSRQMEYSQIYASNQTGVIDALSKAETQMAVRKQQVAVATQQVAAGASHASAQVVAVRNLQHQAVGARTQVTKLLRQAQKANHVAHQLALKDQAALNSLKAQEASIIARILSQSGSDLHRSGVSTNGMLSYPLLGGGVLTSPYGYRINPVWGYWGLHDGDDFAAPCGTPEVAVQSGRVVSEYYSSVWGNRLFLDLGYIDGHNFTVIYNHMARYAVGVGAIVTRGQVVGYEGTTGWSTGCHIHFTVMRDGVAVDPMHYIA